jgi:uncharacterized membrane protein (DUF2068 family)
MANSKKCIGLKVLGIIAILFGLLTLKSGGSVLFIDGAARIAAGNYVPFVLWANFILGFFYIIAGIGIWLQKRWATWLAIMIAMVTLIVFAAFGLHISNDGLFEQRTVIAMILRSSVWLIISILTYFRLIKQNYGQ